MKILKSILLLLCVAFLTQDLSAQYRYGYYRVGISAGATNYLGDLDDDFPVKFTRPGIAIEGSYRMNPFMSARLSVFQGWIGATDEVSSDAERNARNLSFRSTITEVSAQVVFDFIATDRRYQFRPPFVPYVFGGIALFQFNPQAQIAGEWYDLQPLGTEGQHLASTPNGVQYPESYSLTQFSIPMGAGLRFALTRLIDLEVETGFRKTFTDYLDDVSGEYPNLEDLRSQNPIAAALSDRSNRSEFPNGLGEEYARGDRTQADWYIYSAVRLNIILDWVKCPQFR
ncbi:DUF6089 family protein [Pontibacter sp. G13]|uniref:DUF6089 family protein n=1 Tax=Pontibacter sp. G13 TaxID=3074898 RepID=UPI00288C41C6|nr:DUF6089 family protein [Pontibacter sp. G13]WNJ16491.1 DUF6089 family protein [Pontibacter sp. G13]